MLNFPIEGEARLMMGSLPNARNMVYSIEFVGLQQLVDARCIMLMKSKEPISQNGKKSWRTLENRRLSTSSRNLFRNFIVHVIQCQRLSKIKK